MSPFHTPPPITRTCTNTRTLEPAWTVQAVNGRRPDSGHADHRDHRDQSPSSQPRRSAVSRALQRQEAP